MDRFIVDCLIDLAVADIDALISSITLRQMDLNNRWHSILTSEEWKGLAHCAASDPRRPASFGRGRLGLAKSPSRLRYLLDEKSRISCGSLHFGSKLWKQTKAVLFDEMNFRLRTTKRQKQTSFVRILEQDQLNHAYLSSKLLWEAWKWQEPLLYE